MYFISTKLYIYIFLKTVVKHHTVQISNVYGSINADKPCLFYILWWCRESLSDLSENRRLQDKVSCSLKKKSWSYCGFLANIIWTNAVILSYYLRIISDTDQARVIPSNSESQSSFMHKVIIDPAIITVPWA